ncbi:hypothetical protein TIFTF001_011185 [Ficus carica]|uniref:Uncharacterized protein n=1 Tax=Ficus carica TaxID=3494 RepID=A0AA88AL73_FICCA|nr:hypothetical protein TIFTF001_011185 [Ficus carica]
MGNQNSFAEIKGCFIVKFQAFNPLRIRSGGSLQDLVVYDAGKAETDCPQFKLDKNGLFGFSNGCLPHKKWDELDTLFNLTGALVTFGLNALYGKHASQQGILWVGAWDPHNARDLIKYTIEKGYKIDSYELGNELCGYGVAARLDGVKYGKDLMTIGPEVVDGVTHHIYHLGSGVDPNLISKIQDPFYLDHVAQTYEHVSRSVEKYAPMAGAWIGDGGGAYNSGGKNVQDRFVGGF